MKRVHEHTVGAHVLDVKDPIHVFDQRVSTGDIGIRESPLIVWQPANRAARGVEHFATGRAQFFRLGTGDFEHEDHGAPHGLVYRQ